MRKKIIGGMLSLLIAGGLFFQLAAPARASYVSAADASTAAFMVQSAADVLGMSSFAFMLKLYELKTSGQNMASILEESGLSVDEFTAEMKAKIAARLQEIQSANPTEGMNERLKGFVSSRNNLNQIFLIQLYSKMQNRKASIKALQDAFKDAVGNAFSRISTRLSGE